LIIDAASVFSILQVYIVQDTKSDIYQIYLIVRQKTIVVKKQRCY